MREVLANVCPSGQILGAMNRLQFVLVPLLAAVGVLAYAAQQDAIDVEHIVGVVVFLVIAVPVGIFGYRLSQEQSER